MKRQSLGVVAALAWISLVTSGSAQERILSFHSDITVHEDASMTVVESIRVRAEGDQIKRGIYRDFPTTYKDRTGHRYRVGFSVTSVAKNGEPEPFALEFMTNGERVRIGRESVILPAGEYTYEITYDTDRQIGYFEDHDELYWNVTGLDWGFVIDQASTTVRLPDSVGADAIEIEGYTGPKGSGGQQYKTSLIDSRHAHIVTTQALSVYEGLTVVVSWPKGHVYEPTRQEKFMFLLQDNRSALVALAGLCVALAYYTLIWVMVGKDPAKGTIIPRYGPPAGISPGAARYIWKMGYDHRCLAAALIHLGVQGRLRVKEDDGEYSIQKLDANAGTVSLEEGVLFKKLLGSRSSLTFKQSNHKRIGGALDAYKTGLSAAYEKVYFLKNTRYWVPGILITAFTLLATAWYGNNPGEALFMGLWLSIWSIGVLALGWAVFQAWKNAISGPTKITGAFGAMFLTAFALPFFLGEAFGLFVLSRAISPLSILVLVVLVVVVLTFYHLMKAPTLVGRRTMDELDGFRQYLSVAEEDRLALMHPPQQTPELFEQFLPYALALDVEQEWAEYFADLLNAVGADEELPRHPAWYHSTHGNLLGAGAIAAAVGGSLSSAISSSSTAPGSSSGSSGGGSSGGGGGGGGGGGW